MAEVDKAACGTCRHARPDSAGAPVHIGVQVLECWRYPPQVVAAAGGVGVMQPRVASTAVCGEWAAKAPPLALVK